MYILFYTLMKTLYCLYVCLLSARVVLVMRTTVCFYCSVFGLVVSVRRTQWPPLRVVFRFCQLFCTLHFAFKKAPMRELFYYLFFLASFSASFSALSCLAFSAFSASSLFCSSILAALSASYLDFDSSYFESSSSR